MYHHPIARSAKILPYWSPARHQETCSDASRTNRAKRQNFAIWNPPQGNREHVWCMNILSRENFAICRSSKTARSTSETSITYRAKRFLRCQLTEVSLFGLPDYRGASFFAILPNRGLTFWALRLPRCIIFAMPNTEVSLFGRTDHRGVSFLRFYVTEVSIFRRPDYRGLRLLECEI